jgi:hypothetical protein
MTKCPQCDRELTTISLTQGKCAIVAIESYELVKDIKWYASKIGNTFYARWWRRGQKTKYMHRLILNPNSNLETDHIDGYGLNNCICNLRPASHADSAHNSQFRKNNSSGYTGVSWDKTKQMFVARVSINKKQINLGLFETAEQAGKIAAEARKEYFGAFAPDVSRPDFSKKTNLTGSK